VRGASAIGRILNQLPDSDLRVFVVWEPVLVGDRFRHGDRYLAGRMHDLRARHYWDPSKSLSAEILKSDWTRKYAVRGGALGVVWDWVALYPRGVRWGDQFPEPAVQGFPVVDTEDQVRAWAGAPPG